MGCRKGSFTFPWLQINTACSGHLVAWILGEMGVEQRMRQVALERGEEQLAGSSHWLLPGTIQSKGPWAEKWAYEVTPVPEIGEH